MRDLWREVCDWWQRRYHPHPVATFTNPTYLDEEQWAATLPIRHLRRAARSLDRLARRKRLVGENITRLRAIRAELRRRLEASQRPNRTVMDHLSDADRGFIRQFLTRREAKQ